VRHEAEKAQGRRKGGRMIASETMERTAVVDGERSVSAGAETRNEAAATAVGRSADPEVAQVAKRRKYSSEYKLRILEEVENNPGKIGMILRREGLYSSNVTRWKRWRDGVNNKSKSSINKQLHNELAKKDREIKRLQLKLQKAEGIIELQKKTSEMLHLMSKNQDEES
jgi:transposase-like protein